jgi:hypothetical protein
MSKYEKKAIKHKLSLTKNVTRKCRQAQRDWSNRKYCEKELKRK